MKRWIKRTACIMLCVLLLTATGCRAFDNEEVRARTEAMLTAILADDVDAAYACMAPSIERAPFDEGYEQVHTLIGGVETYELKAIYLQVSVNNGVKTTQVTYQLLTEETAYEIQAMIDERYAGLISFYVTPSSNAAGASIVGQHPLQLVFLAVAAVETAFVVWMTVDCARRRTKNKVLWLLIILFGMLSVTFTIAGGSMNMGANFGFLLSFTSLSMNGGYYAGARILLPIGAVVYAILRKRLLISEPMPELAPMPPMPPTDGGTTPPA